MRALVLGTVLAVLSGCSNDSPSPPPDAPRETEAPIDELVEGEIPEGGVNAFGLPLPARFVVESNGPLRVVAVGTASLEEVANFVRQRVDAKETVTGPGKTVLEGIRVKAPRKRTKATAEAPGAGAEEVLRVEIARIPGARTKLIVSRRLIEKAAEGLSEEQRWEKLGIRKDGKPADPKKFE